ncbi:hypothetical protein [Variovorax sp. GT1P44]|uniref:hypothetical protein n=1 Tax=Variovorax sp. GT1P44 TaxID=3443742 RepID=UPI003F479DA2
MIFFSPSRLGRPLLAGVTLALAAVGAGAQLSLERSLIRQSGLPSAAHPAAATAGQAEPLRSGFQASWPRSP